MASLSLPSFPVTGATEQIGLVKVCPEIAFANHKGQRKSSIEKKCRKLIVGLQAPLEKFLEPDEVVLAVTKANSPVTGLEQYTLGWLVYYVTAAVLVITNRRLIHLRTTSSSKWAQGIRVCSWQDVAEIKVSGILGKVANFKFRDGSKQRFWNIPRANASVLKKLLPELAGRTPDASSTSGTLASCCPECKQKMAPRVYECSQCRLIFKDEKTMRWLALVPGGAYFYCGKPLLGVFDMIGEGYLLLAVGVYAAEAMVSAGKGNMEEYAVTLAILLFLVGLEVAITMHHCGRFVREFIPTKKHAAGNIQAMAASAGFKT